MDLALIWVVVGVSLVLSELLLTSIIAVFFGIAALIVGGLIHFGIIDSYTAQFFWFGTLSLSLLIVVRRRFRKWFVGDQKDVSCDELASNGTQVKVVRDFNTGGQGRVLLNGVEWSSESVDHLKSGEFAWVIGRRGITIVVSAERPVI